MALRDTSIWQDQEAAKASGGSQSEDEANEAWAICGLCQRARIHTSNDENAASTPSGLASIEFSRLLDAP